MTSIGLLHVFSCTSWRSLLILLNMSEAPQEEKRPNRNSQPLLKGACMQLSYIQYYTTTHSQKYSASPREKKSNHHQPPTPTQLFLCQFVYDCVAYRVSTYPWIGVLKNPGRVSYLTLIGCPVYPVLKTAKTKKNLWCFQRSMQMHPQKPWSCVNLAWPTVTSYILLD